MVLAVLIPLGGCKACDDGTVTGTLSATGDSETWTFTKGKCYSGQRENYFGVIGFGPEGSGVAVKLVKDQLEGWAAVVNIPSTCATQAESGGCKAHVLKAAGCDVFEVSVERTNTTVNDIRLLDGRVRLDCAVEGVRIKGGLVFDGCH